MFPILHTMYYILYTLNYMPHAITYTLYYTPDKTCCSIYAIYHVLYIMYQELYTVYYITYTTYVVDFQDTEEKGSQFTETAAEGLWSLGVGQKAKRQTYPVQKLKS